MGFILTGIQEILVLLIIILAVLILPRYFSRSKETGRGGFLAGADSFAWTGRMRLAAVASVLWPFLTAVYFKPWEKGLIAYICLGPGPVLLAWGAWWVLIGFRRHRR